MPGRAPRIAIDFRQLAHTPARNRDSHDGVSMLTSELETVWCVQGSNVKLRSRRLGRAGQGCGVLDRMKFSLVGDDIARQQQIDLAYAFSKPAHGLVA